MSIGSLKDAGDPLMAQTINTANTALIAPLERTHVEGEARTSSTNLTVVSRPNRYLDFSMRFRTYDYDNRTPEFALTPARRLRQRAGHGIDEHARRRDAAVVPRVPSTPSPLASSDTRSMWTSA